MYIVWLTLGLVVGAAAAQAQQIDYNLRYLEDQAEFSYRWRGEDQIERQMIFRLPQEVLATSMHDFMPFENFEANQDIARRVEMLAKKEFPEARVVVTGQRDGIKFSARADKVNSVKVMQRLKALELEVREKYIAERLYTFAKENVLMPDHARVAAMYSVKIKPLAQAMLGVLPAGATARQMMTVSLGFFQGLPYDTLKDRYNSSGAGFETPWRMLAQNRGDCDSKSVAYLSLLRHFYPDLGLLVVYTPYHALVGIAIPPQPKDITIAVAGTDYVLAEPVGLALMPVGQISSEALQEIKKGVYSWRVVP